MSHGADLSAAPLYVYNHGYVMGELNRVDFIGFNRRLVAGEISIGNNSFGDGNGAGGELNGDYILNNPWSFCGDQGFYEKLVNYLGEFVVVEYKTPKNSSLLQCQSMNEIIAIYPVSRATPSGRLLESTKLSVPGKPYGVSTGRIVNAQESDKHGNNWSVVIQIGNGGNDFRYLQILDAELYAFALECLSTATKVKVYYVEQIHGSTGAGRIESFVWKIETRPGL